MRRAALLLALAATGPAGAQGFSFRSEAGVAVSYEDSKTTEPLVVIGGVPSGNFEYRADAPTRGLAVSGTHHFRDVTDDGVTPFALQAFVSRASSVSATASLTSRSVDSVGTSRGLNVSITSYLTGDSSTRAGSLSGEWFLHRSTSVRAGVTGSWARDTTATRQLESPSGRGDLASISTESSSGRASLGVARRFGGRAPVDGARGLTSGFEGELLAEGTWGRRDVDRTDDLLFSDGGFRRYDYAIDGTTWSAALSARALLAARRLLVEARGAYADSEGELSEDGLGRLERTGGIVRTLGGSATFFPCRAAGGGVFAAYGREKHTSGLVSQVPVSGVRALTLGIQARVFPSPRGSVSLSLARVVEETLIPPSGATFQKLRETATRVELAGSIRF